MKHFSIVYRENFTPVLFLSRFFSPFFSSDFLGRLKIGLTELLLNDNVVKLGSG